ncbi:MAG: transporter substrate-binding domain-containing protein [Sedimentibacter sp.]|uniref:transporter substrate-binding domain-containing protein n=1 Tax=Sedimentibacter sp. TaxID=1960295 RepID=UPI00315987CB
MKPTGKILLIILFCLTATFFIAANLYIENNYGLSLYEYFQYSAPLTEEESEYLKEKGTLYFSSDKNAPPFAYVDNKTEQYKGLVLDYASSLSIELETDIEFVPQVWENVIYSVTSGSADMCDIFPSEERMKYLTFSKPIYSLSAIVMTDRRNDKVQKADDLTGLTVAMPAGDYALEYIRDNIPNVKVVETPDLYEAINIFRQGKADAVVGDEPVLIHFADELGIGGDVKILDQVLYDREVCIGVRKSETILVSILNKGILSLKKSNSFEKIQQKWFGISAPALQYKAPEKLIMFFIAMIVLLVPVFIGMTLWSYTLKEEVLKRTDDLNKSRNNLQMTVDSLSSLLICINKDGIIVNANKSFCDFMNLSQQEVEGKSFKDFPILHNIGTQALKVPSEFMHGGRVYSHSVSEIDNGDYNYLIVIEDITDMKLSQQQMLQQNKMIALGQLAAGVAHEIRNPLGLIQNYCYILKTYVLDENHVAGESIEVIESSVQRVDKIVDNLLNFSRTESDKTAVINVKEAILSIVSLENKLSKQKHIDVEVDCKEDIKLLTRPESLNHIVLNLLSNSIDAMPDGGKITIVCREQEGFLHIDFIDTGTGIRQENIEKIFNPFFTTKKVGQGTGLGLYIVYNEVQKIGGEIKVESRFNEGTAFMMKFPMLKEICKNV